jgi:hypothetical protein
MPLSRVWLRDDDDTGLEVTCNISSTEATEAIINSGMEVFTQDADGEELTEAEWQMLGDLDSSIN